MKLEILNKEETPRGVLPNSCPFPADWSCWWPEDYCEFHEPY